MALQSNPGYTTFHGGVVGFAYNEPAFSHFLAIERRRAERSSRSIVLVLVSVRSQTGKSSALDHMAASELFACLGAAVREVDFVGWYREGRIAAAVLTQRLPASQEVCGLVAQRVTQALNVPTLRSHGRVRVRVVALRGRTERQGGVKQSRLKQSGVK
jgi:hypothetical protein